MKLAVHQLNGCRICSGGRLERFLHLPAMPFTDDFVTPQALGTEFRHDIDVFYCLDCGTAQTQHNVDVRDYYEDYQYSVGASETASRFMRLLAGNLVTRYFPGRKGLKVLEVGSGDGGQLIAFKELGCEVLGYEPSSMLARQAEASGVPTVQGLFGSGSLDRLPPGFRQADVVALSYTFDHLPEPREFLRAAKSILNPESGLLVVEVHDLQKIFERQEFCLFEHEHSIYLTAASAAALLAREGMTVIDFDLVPETDRRANSLIFVAAPQGSRLGQPLAAAKPQVPKGYSEPGFYREQANLIQRGIANLDKFVERAASTGKTVAGYGAGGRGVMTLAAMRSARKLQYLVDRKPKAPGLVTPKSGVPVVGLAALQDSPVDELLVFSFGYLREIQTSLAPLGYQARQLHSLVDVLAGKAQL